MNWNAWATAWGSSWGRSWGFDDFSNARAAWSSPRPLGINSRPRPLTTQAPTRTLTADSRPRRP